MVLRIHNTKSGRDEVFEPHKEGRVAMYVCGPTTYDHCHIGHARSYVFYDVVRRYLAFLGLKVTYVQNFTDIDEKITKRAAALGEDPFGLSERFIKAFLEDMDALGVMRADHNPRTSENIDGVVEMARELVENGVAYEVGGTVFFDAGRMDGFGSLLHAPLSEVTVENGASGAQDTEGRRGPQDFVVWKAGNDWGITWDSPWGKGRPGWHSECSVMSRRYLGDVMDIHGGGLDLIYPHHESEAALSAALTGKEPVRFYMHNGFVVQDEVKMSKSKGNFTTVRALLKERKGALIRYFLLTKHYRKTLAYTNLAMDVAEERFDTIKEAARWVERRAGGAEMEDEKVGRAKEKGTYGDCPDKYFEFERMFLEAMDDDFDTAHALTVVHDMANCVLQNRPKREDAETARRVFGMVETVLGIHLFK